jgi:hypothetical protein
MTGIQSARRKQKILTTTTKTTASPSSPKVGDLIRFTDSDFPDWCGQEGVVLSLDGDMVNYRVTKSAPTKLSKHWNTVGDERTNEYYRLTIITESLNNDPAEEDVVNHPSHYTQYPVEVIELTEHMDFCRGNAVKYLARAGHKDPAKELEDLKKSLWYVQRAISKLEKEQT